MAIKTKSQITTTISANISDALNKQNTAALVREVCNDLNDTMFSGKTYEATLSITSAQILALYGTPLDIVATPGAGYYIEAISASCIMTYGSAVYVTNVSLGVWCAGAGAPQLQNATALISTASRTTKFYIPVGITGDSTTQLVENTALQIKVSTGNPSVGDGTAIVKVLYRIVAI